MPTQTSQQPRTPVPPSLPDSPTHRFSGTILGFPVSGECRLPDLGQDEQGQKDSLLFGTCHLIARWLKDPLVIGGGFTAAEAWSGHRIVWREL